MRGSRLADVPRNAERSIAARYAALQKRFAQRQQQAAHAAAQQELDGIRERARLCERLETGVLGGGLAEADRQALLQDTAHAWEALAPLETASESALRQRFELVSRALDGDAEARQALEGALAKNLSQGLDLCLQIEIEAGIDSPAGFEEARMQLQVSRLEEVLQHRQEDAAADRLRVLQIAWHQAGPLPPAEKPTLEARFARALAAMQGG